MGVECVQRGRTQQNGAEIQFCIHAQILLIYKKFNCYSYHSDFVSKDTIIVIVIKHVQ